LGYPANYGNVKVMQWYQGPPELVSITRATMPSFWHGFRMTRLALTTLTGFDGKTVLRAHRATGSRAGA